MPRWTGTWLQGPEVTLGELRHPETWPGARLGLPQEGPGSLASFSARAMGFAVDILASLVVAWVVNHGVLHHPADRTQQLTGYVVLATELVLTVALTGRTLGMRLVGLRVAPLRDPEHVPGFVAAAVRTLVLLVTVGLAGFFTKDGRGLHDLAAGSVVVRT